MTSRLVVKEVIPTSRWRETVCSSVYTPELAALLAKHISKDIRKLDVESNSGPDVSGHENVVVNDHLQQPDWKVVSSWSWSGVPGHINVRRVEPMLDFCDSCSCVAGIVDSMPCLTGAWHRAHMERGALLPGLWVSPLGFGAAT